MTLQIELELEFVSPPPPRGPSERGAAACSQPACSLGFGPREPHRSIRLERRAQTGGVYRAPVVMYHDAALCACSVGCAGRQGWLWRHAA
eukprot:8077469-Pyramimonas_sp.AAC.1